MGVITAPELLGTQHHLADFNCNRPSLDNWLRKRAMKAQQGGSARTYVVCSETGHVVGYYALATGSIDRDDAPGKVKKKHAPPYPRYIAGEIGCRS